MKEMLDNDFDGKYAEVVKNEKKDEKDVEEECEQIITEDVKKVDSPVSS